MESVAMQQSSTRQFVIQLDDTTSLQRLARAMEAWDEAMSKTTEMIGPDHVLGIEVEDLSPGSAMISLLGTFDSDQSANDFTAEIVRFNRAVGSGKIDALPPKLQSTAIRMRKVSELDNGAGMVLATQDEDVYVAPTRDGGGNIVPFRYEARKSESYGVLTGRLQQITSRSGVRGSLYDVVFDRAVRIYFNPDAAEELRQKWNKEVQVTGLIRRDPASGLPLSVRDVTSTVELESKVNPDAWRVAYGVLSGQLPDVPSAELVRRLREND
ncbi:MAG: hypothetical protein KF883_07230 [Thermomicrobiales bacterium]|nr:hypothetical protein [Thermomicrobiales bacterium]